MIVRLRNLQRKFAVSPERIRSWAASALAGLGLKEAELGLLLVGDRKIRELNRHFRKTDRSTNVLAFPIETAPPENRPYLLGDVVISVETAAREAAEAEVPLDERLKVLLIHGILHLNGLDHERSFQDSKRMAGEERRLLKSIKGPKNGLVV
jgi:rRNA maturation RNase YbeY